MKKSLGEHLLDGYDNISDQGGKTGLAGLSSHSATYLSYKICYYGSMYLPELYC